MARDCVAHVCLSSSPCAPVPPVPFSFLPDRWTGGLPSLDELAEEAGADACIYASDLPQYLQQHHAGVCMWGSGCQGKRRCCRPLQKVRCNPSRCSQDTCVIKAHNTWNVDTHHLQMPVLCATNSVCWTCLPCPVSKTPVTDADTLHLLESDHPDHQQQLLATHLGQHQQQQAQQLAALQALHSARPALQFNTAFLDSTLSRCRATKTPAEVACLLRASQGSAAAHRAMWAACQPGVHEYQLEAAFVHACLNEGNMQLG